MPAKDTHIVALSEDEPPIPPTASSFAESIRYFFRWEKSIFQLLWKQVLVYFALYILVTIIRNFALSDDDRKTFESIAMFCNKYTTLAALPVAFLLAPHTTQSLNRYFAAVQAIPGVSKIISTFMAFLKDESVTKENGQKCVDRCARYVLLAWLLNFRLIHSPLRVLYPDLVAVQQAGFLTEKERVELEKESMPASPIVVWQWMRVFLTETLQKDYFRGGLTDYKTLLEQMTNSKKAFGNILKAKSNNIPLILCQASNIVLHVYGLFSIIGHMSPVEYNAVTFAIQSYVPFFHSLPFFLYYAFWKVGQMVADPFGGDANDLDITALFDGHVQMAEWLCDQYRLKAATLLDEESRCWSRKAKGRCRFGHSRHKAKRR